MIKIQQSLKSGFTLLETTIVIGIASLILTIGSNLFVFSKQAARDVVRKTDLDQIRAALEFYRENDSNRYYPAILSDLNGEFITEIPTDPLTSLNYCYEFTDSTNYLLSAKLERGGPSSCNCNSKSYNYCYSPLGLLLTPTPTATPIPTATPTPTPYIGCSNVTVNIGQTATFSSGNDNSYWTMDSNNPLNCSEIVGGGRVFVTTCQKAGTTTVHVSDTQTGATNICQLTISQ